MSDDLTVKQPLEVRIVLTDPATGARVSFAGGPISPGESLTWGSVSWKYPDEGLSFKVSDG